jgi:hypothetical protein
MLFLFFQPARSSDSSFSSDPDTCRGPYNLRKIDSFILEVIRLVFAPNHHSCRKVHTADSHTDTGTGKNNFLKNILSFEIHKKTVLRIRIYFARIRITADNYTVPVPVQIYPLY